MATEERIPLRQRQQDELEARFKPIFDQYEEQGGIPLRVLRNELQRQDATQYLDAGNIELLLQRADTDADGHLEWGEFHRLATVTEPDKVAKLKFEMTQRAKGHDAHELTAFQKMVRGAVSSVVPGQERIESGELVVEDYISHYNCKPPPLFMILISIIELVIFIVYAVELKGSPYEVTANSGVPLYSPLIYNPARRYEAWRYLTYMFIHSGYMHLIFNLIFQLVLGIPLEMVHKWWRVGIVYSLGVIAGSMGHSIADHNTLLAGASGGCYSLIGAHIAIVVMNWKEMTHGWMDGPVRFISSAPVRLFLWISMAAIDTGLAIYSRYSGTGKANVGYAAHFAGALAGLLIGIPVLKNIHVKPWEKIVWWVSLIAYLVCCILAILFNIFYPDYPETDWKKCCEKPSYLKN